MDMNKNFPEWYRVACIEINDEQIKSRWKGIETYCNTKIDDKEVLELVRLFYGRPCKDEFREKFVTSFFDADKVFPQKNNFELSVLAGAALMHIIDNNEKFDNVALLAIISASFNRKKICVPDILNNALIEFDNKRIAIRDITKELNVNNLDISKNKKLLELLNTAKDSNTLNFQEFGGIFIKYLTLLGDYINYNQKQQQIYKEDSQILWWMTGEWSRDLQKPYKQFKAIDVCFTIGKELSDMVEILPGPFASKAILNKVMSLFPEEEINNIALVKAVDQSDKNWRQDVVKKYSAEETREITPLLVAINESVKVEKKSEWKSAYKVLTDFDANTIKMSALDLVYQIYLECLICKSLRK